jgi:hypothetical protein
MAATKSKRAAAPRRPEKKIGPFHNGLGIAIWLNSVETENGPRYFRSYVALRWRRREVTCGAFCWLVVASAKMSAIEKGNGVVPQRSWRAGSPLIARRTGGSRRTVRLRWKGRPTRPAEPGTSTPYAHPPVK